MGVESLPLVTEMTQHMATSGPILRMRTLRFGEGVNMSLHDQGAFGPAPCAAFEDRGEWGWVTHLRAT